MTLSWRTRRRIALLLLCVGLPAYIVGATSLAGLFDRPPFPLELAIYVGAGILWILPFRAVFRGIGKPDPSESPVAARNAKTNSAAARRSRDGDS